MLVKLVFNKFDLIWLILALNHWRFILFLYIFFLSVAELSGEASTSVSGEASTSVQSVESGTSAVHVLSNELHHLLETISKCMMRHKRSVVFSQCDDLWVIYFAVELIS